MNEKHEVLGGGGGGGGGGGKSTIVGVLSNDSKIMRICAEKDFKT